VGGHAGPGRLMHPLGRHTPRPSPTPPHLGVGDREDPLWPQSVEKTGEFPTGWSVGARPAQVVYEFLRYIPCVTAHAVATSSPFTSSPVA